MAMIPLTGENPSIDSIIGLDISNPQDGQAIVYDAASGTWKNANAGGGGGGGVLVVNLTYDENEDTYTADKTAGEMWSAFQSGGVLLIETADDGTFASLVVNASLQDSGYRFLDAAGFYILEAETADDYPVSGSAPS